MKQSKNRARHSIQGWLADDMLLETYCYAPGPPEGVPRHAHEEYQFGLNLTDEGSYWYRGGHHVVPVDCLTVIHPGEPHETRGNFRDVPSLHRMMYVPTERLRQAQIQVWGEWATSASLPFFPEPILLNDALVQTFLILHQALETSCSRLEQDSRLLLALTRLICGAAERRPELPLIAPASPARSRRDPVRLAQEFLRAHYADNVSLDELANVAGLSAFHLCRRFRQTVGFPPHIYQILLRLNRAKTLLSAGLPPAQVAVEVGFYDQSHFGAAFKRMVGVTPGAYASRTPSE